VPPIAGGSHGCANQHRPLLFLPIKGVAYGLPPALAHWRGGQALAAPEGRKNGTRGQLACAPSAGRAELLPTADSSWHTQQPGRGGAPPVGRCRGGEVYACAAGRAYAGERRGGVRLQACACAFYLFIFLMWGIEEGP
jgi:hypothetical protein